MYNINEYQLADPTEKKPNRSRFFKFQRDKRTAIDFYIYRFTKRNLIRPPFNPRHKLYGTWKYNFRLTNLEQKL